MTADEAISINSAPQNPVKKKRNLPGNPDPEAEVIALSPKTLMATNRFVCEICGKGFQRDQNLQLHRRGHNLPWKLKQRSGTEIRKRVYVCPEKGCVHHEAGRALGDLTGIKKHFCRKHGEKKWNCDKCDKRYAVHSDWKAHSKTCGTREYSCDCGTIFSRRDSFITHRAFCEALAEETARLTAASHMNINHTANINYHFNIGSSTVLGYHQHFPPTFKSDQNTDPSPMGRGLSLWMAPAQNLQQQMHQIGASITCGSQLSNFSTPHDPLIDNNPSQLNWDFENNQNPISNVKEISVQSLFSSQTQSDHQPSSAAISATALLQKAAQIGATTNGSSMIMGNFGNQNDGNKLCGLYSTIANSDVMEVYPSKRRRMMMNDGEKTGGETRDFLGVGIQSMDGYDMIIKKLC